MKRFFVAGAILLASLSALAQDPVEMGTTPYIPAAEEEVRANVAEWQDYKFGMFIHWGAYSQLGIIESWSLVPDDISWMQKPRKGMPYYEYVKMYEGLKKTFNPTSFDPAKWAAAAKYAGMKYMVFTTKHHDGFSMFDTAQNDYKITSKECPFHVNPKANVAKEVFNAFRAEGIATGAYFSIVDWHNNDFWWDVMPPKNRYINYEVSKHPEKWARYQDYLAAQLGELTSGEYGKLNLLWFDLCKCAPDGSAPVDWPRLASVIRGNQPSAMMVARGENSIYENYRTPEQLIPDQALDYPWESCITMTMSWAWRPNLEYKPVSEMLGILVKVVSRGGNLLLNVGPRPDGTLEETAYERLKAIGDWMQVNSEAIYGTKAYAPYQDGDVYYTTKDGYVYAFYIPSEQGESLPSVLSFKGVKPSGASSVQLLGTKKTLRWQADGEGIKVVIPESVRKNLPCEHIWCLKIKI